MGAVGVLGGDGWGSRWRDAGGVVVVSARAPRVILAQITAPHFCAGIGVDTEEKVVVDASPVVRYMVGWTARRVHDYCCDQGWKVERVKE